MKNRANKFVLRTPRDANALWGVLKCWSGQAEVGQPLEVTVRVYDDTRTKQQNDLMWPILRSFSSQISWDLNGENAHLSDNDWKHIMTASFTGEEMRMSRTLSGDLIILPVSTSSMKKKPFSEFIEFLYASAAELGVKLNMDEAA